MKLYDKLQINQKKIKSPKVSIILPFRNACITINECIHSILEQNFSLWELIAVNDRSKDGTENIIKIFPG